MTNNFKKLLLGILTTISIFSSAYAGPNGLETFESYADGQSLFDIKGYSGTTDNVARIMDMGGNKVAAFRGSNRVNAPQTQWTPGNSGEVLTLEWDMSISPDISGGAAIGIFDSTFDGKNQFVADPNIFEESRVLGGDRETGFHYALVADSRTGVVRYFMNGVQVNETKSIPGSKWNLDHFVFVTTNMSDDGYVTLDNLQLSTAGTKFQLRIADNYVREGDTILGEVTLPAPAPKGGQVVLLSSNNGAVTTPKEVTVAEGDSQATFQFTANSTDKNIPYNIVAAIGNIKAIAASTVRSITLRSFRSTSYTIKSGGSAKGILQLEASALKGGKALMISSSSPVASVPGSVTITAGSDSTGFPINIAKVKVRTRITIRVACGDRTSQITITALP